MLEDPRGRGSKRAPHTTTKSAEQTCVHIHSCSYLWQVFSDFIEEHGCRWSLTPWRLFSVPGSRSPQRASGLRVHLSLWSPPSPGSKTKEQQINISTAIGQKNVVHSRTPEEESYWFWWFHEVNICDFDLNVRIKPPLRFLLSHHHEVKMSICPILNVTTKYMQS